MNENIVERITNLLANVGDWLKAHYNDSSLKNIIKKDSRNITFGVDWNVEETILRGLEEIGLNAIVITEEREKVKIGNGKTEWYIFLDPLDGSKNYVNNIPYSAISLAMCKYKNEIYFSDIEIGFVHDIWNGTTYYATPENATLKGDTSPPNPIIIGYMTGPAFNIFRHFKKLGYNVRTFGSAALDLLQVAFGRAEAFLDPISKMRVFDIAGAYVILRHAGGVIYDANGENYKGKLILRGDHINLTLNSVLAFRSNKFAKKYFEEIENIAIPEEFIIKVGRTIKKNKISFSYDGKYIIINGENGIRRISPGQSICYGNLTLYTYPLSNKITVIEMNEITP